MTTLWRLFRDQRPLWPGVLLLMVLAAVLPPLAVATPLIERHLIDGVILAQQPASLLPAVALYGGIWLLHTAVSICAATLNTYLGERVQQGLRQRLLAHCAALAVPFSHKGHTGQTMALFTSDVPAIGGFPTTLALTAVGSLVGIAVAAATMVTLNWQLALAAALAPPAVAGAAAVLTRPLRPAARRAQEKAAELSERLQETLAGLREVVAFGQEATAGRRFATTLGDLLRLRMRLTFIDTGMRTGQSVFVLAVTIVLMGYGGYLVLQGKTTLGTLVAMQTLFGLVLQPVTQLAGIAREAQKTAGASERVYAFLDTPPQVADRAAARALQPGPLPVVFDGVGFAYEPGRPVLEEISFAVQPGETVALVGPSGAGKTTLVSLLPRFYDPTAGRILLGGDDLRDISLHALRARIGFVFQDTFLFSGTVRENIAFGAPAAGEAAIVAALEAAHAWEFVARLPAGAGRPASASAGSTSRRGRSSASPSPGPSCATPPS